MKRFIMLFVLATLATGLVAQTVPDAVWDGQTAPTEDNYRKGFLQMVYDDATGKYYAVKSDSLGNLSISTAPYTSTYCDSVTATQADTTYISFGTTVDFIHVYCDDDTKAFRIGFNDADPNLRIKAGAVYNVPANVDSIGVTLVSGSAQVVGSAVKK